MGLYFWEKDFSATVHDYDFTRKAIRHIHKIVNSEDFEDMDVDMIFDLLLNEMEIVSFRDYLKRYIYERVELEEPFRKVPDEVYKEIIMDSFASYRAPHSFTPTTVKWGMTVKRWLEQENVQRSTIFLLGFGLKMTEEDVSEFLTKVIQEEDFDTSSPRELIFRFCYKKGLPYSKAAEYLDYYQKLDQASLPEESVLWEDAPAGDFSPDNENELLSLLRRVKTSGMTEQKAGLRRRCFLSLYEKCREIIADMYQDDENIQGTKKDWTPEQISPADIEKMLSEGIPLTVNGNLKKMSASLLGRQFRQKRITRQRLDCLLKNEMEADRYDLITLQFFISAQDEEEDPQERCRNFVDKVNEMLEECGMMKLYPANPFEAFVLMCLLTDIPLLTWYDVWEKSYAE